MVVILLDTSIIVDHLRRKAIEAPWAHAHGISPSASSERKSAAAVKNAIHPRAYARGIPRRRTKQEVQTKLDQVSSQEVVLKISTVTIQELFEGRSSSKRKEAARIKKLLQIFDHTPLTPDIAELAGCLSRDHGSLEFADASIAASTILENAQLYTLNRRHFHNIPRLKFYQ